MEKLTEMGTEVLDKEKIQVDSLNESWGVILVKKDGKVYLINMGTSSLDLIQQGYSDSNGNFDLVKYFPDAEQLGVVVEVQGDDLGAMNEEFDNVNGNRHAEWPTVQKYLDQIKK